MGTERLFIAIPLPSEVREELAACAEPIRAIGWTRPEQIHLTLRFIGDVQPEAAVAIESGLAGIRVEPFILSLAGAGVFPPRGDPRVIWIGVGENPARLFQLRQQIDDSLLARGVEVDLRTFHPHVTLARVRDGAAPGAAREVVKRHRDYASPPFRVDSFQLIGSELLPSGPAHTLKREFALVAGR